MCESEHDGAGAVNHDAILEVPPHRAREHGALVVVYLFFVAVSGAELAEEPGWAIAALVLGILWLAHSWKRLLTGGASPAPDRERRGF